MSDKRGDKLRKARKDRAIQRGGVVRNAIRVIFGMRPTSAKKRKGRA